MAWTYELTAATGKLRLDIGDTDVADEGARAIFSDEEIAYFLASNIGRKRAAAAALDVIATKIAQVMRDITSQDVSTFGSRTAAEVRKQAESLRAQAELECDVLVW